MTIPSMVLAYDSDGKLRMLSYTSDKTPAALSENDRIRFLSGQIKEYSFTRSFIDINGTVWDIQDSWIMLSETFPLEDSEEKFWMLL